MSPFEVGLALAAIKPLVDELFVQAKGAFTGQVRKTLAKHLVRNLSARAQDISQVKTILCLEHSLPITDFYSPQFVKLPSGERVEVATPATLADYPRMVIAGVAGQGKSILFRYLALHELASRRLPLFIELRNFEHTPDIQQLLVSELGTLGFPEDLQMLRFLFDSGLAAIYFDAFDEIPHGQQQKARKQIEDLSRRHATCRIYISSRPTLNIESSNYFRVARLDNLSAAEAKSTLRRMCGEHDSFTQIEEELKRADNRVSKLLTTPLMVALLLLHHRATGEFPETEQAFFGDLFDVLMRRHDQTKGYKRHRRSKASEQELADLFAYSCYAFKKRGTIESPRSLMVEVCENGIAFYKRTFAPADALDDIVEGTNLLLEEGTMCRFAHKAVQEFYAARFLSGQAENDVKTFLNNRVRSWNDWEQVIEFLELINPYMFCKHFLIPHAGWVAFGDEDKRIPVGWEPSKTAFQKVFGDDLVGVRENRIAIFGASHMLKFYHLRRRQVYPTVLERVSKEVVWDKLPYDPKIDSPLAEWPILHSKFHDVKLYRMGSLLKSEAGDVFRAALAPVLQAAGRDMKQVYEFIDHRERQTEFFS